MSKNDIADKLAQGVRRALNPSKPELAAPAEPAPAARPASAARPPEVSPRRPAAHSDLHPARIWPD